MGNRRRGAIVCIYRQRNAALTRAMLAPALDAHWPVALWGLDGVHPDLASWTVGDGPGLKFDLVLQLASAVPEDRGLVVADDDVEFTAGDVVRLVAVGERTRLDIAQPAHDAGSVVSHELTRAFPGAYARLTSFVEIGPVLAIRAPARQRVLATMHGRGMGWGLDVDWSLDGEFRLGVVDAVRLRHLGPLWSGYESDDLWDELVVQLRAAGYEHPSDIQRTLQVMRVRQLPAPWLLPAGLVGMLRSVRDGLRR